MFSMTRTRVVRGASVLALLVTLGCSGGPGDSGGSSGSDDADGPRVDTHAETCDQAFDTTCNEAAQAAFDIYGAEALGDFLESDEFDLERIEPRKLAQVGAHACAAAEAGWEPVDFLLDSSGEVIFVWAGEASGIWNAAVTELCPSHKDEALDSLQMADEVLAFYLTAISSVYGDGVAAAIQNIPGHESASREQAIGMTASFCMVRDFQQTFGRAEGNEILLKFFAAQSGTQAQIQDEIDAETGGGLTALELQEEILEQIDGNASPEVAAVRDVADDVCPDDT